MVSLVTKLNCENEKAIALPTEIIELLKIQLNNIIWDKLFILWMENYDNMHWHSFLAVIIFGMWFVVFF